MKSIVWNALIIWCVSPMLGAGTAKLSAPEFQGPEVVFQLANATGKWDLLLKLRSEKWRVVQQTGETSGDPTRTVNFRIFRSILPSETAIFIAGSQLDSDADGLSNVQEDFVYQSNPALADTDGDGTSDGAEVAAGTNPIDFYEGLAPQLTRISGNQQEGKAGSLLQQPFVARVTRDGLPLANAPVTCKVTLGGGSLAASGTSGAGALSLVVRSDASGNVRVSLKFGAGIATLHRVAFGAFARTDFAGRSGGISVVDFLATMREAPNPTENAVLWLRSESLPMAGQSIDFWPDSSAMQSHPATATWPPIESALPRVNDLPGLALGGTIKAAVFDGVNDVLELNSMSAVTMDSATVVTLCLPNLTVTRTARVPSTTFGNRYAGVSGQRYLLASDVALGGFPWGTSPTTAPSPLEVSVWHNFRYKEEWEGLSELRKKYLGTDKLLKDSARSNLTENRRLDGTADRLWYYGSAYDSTNPLHRPSSEPDPYDLVATAMAVTPNEFPGFQGWQWQLNDLDIPVRTEYFTTEPAAPEFTTHHRNGRPLKFEESYYQLQATTYTHPSLTATTQPSTVGDVGIGISVAANGTGTFELRDGEASPLVWNRNIDEYYPAMCSLAENTVNWRVVAAQWSGKTPSLGHATAVGWSGLVPGLASKAGTLKQGPRWLGGSPAPISGNFFQGALAELLIFPSALSEEIRRRAEDFLGAKVGMTWDRNANGIADHWEDSFLYSRRLQGGFSSEADPDGDGIANRLEFQRSQTSPTRAFTYPTLPDSDGDTLRDGDEPIGFDPTSADSDGDGFSDKIEVQVGKDGNLDQNVDGIPDGWPNFGE